MKQSKPGNKISIDGQPSQSVIGKKEKNKASGDALNIIVSGKEQVSTFTTRLPANLKMLALKKSSELGISLNAYIKYLIMKDLGLM